MDGALQNGIGYAGTPYAPPGEAYVGVNPADLWAAPDSGEAPRRSAGHLLPLQAAAAFEAAFATEAGPLSTWRN